MLICEDKGLIFRTMRFLSFIAGAMGRKKQKYLEFNALSVGFKIYD